jgi:hypothetical protein
MHDCQPPPPTQLAALCQQPPQGLVLRHKAPCLARSESEACALNTQRRSPGPRLQQLCRQVLVQSLGVCGRTTPKLWGFVGFARLHDAPRLAVAACGGDRQSLPTPLGALRGSRLRKRSQQLRALRVALQQGLLRALQAVLQEGVPAALWHWQGLFPHAWHHRHARCSTIVFKIHVAGCGGKGAAKARPVARLFRVSRTPAGLEYTNVH